MFSVNGKVLYPGDVFYCRGYSGYKYTVISNNGVEMRYSCYSSKEIDRGRKDPIFMETVESFPYLAEKIYFQ